MKFVFVFLVSFLSSGIVFAEELNKTVVNVEGLVCDFCSQSIKKVFGKNQNVKSVDINLTTSQVTVVFNPGKNMDDKALRSLIESAGYDATNISR